MPDKPALVSNRHASSYDFGNGHPMRFARTQLSLELAEALGVVTDQNWQAVESPLADEAALRAVHDPSFLEVVKRADQLPGRLLEHVGLATSDTPVFEGIYQAAAGIAGATLHACRLVWTGDFAHAVNLSGGMHHAMPAAASGFCVFNDAAVGIADLLASGCHRVAYVDLDAHHGDGVEQIFAADPRVLTISLHQDGRTMFPGTGHSTDIGAVGAEGTAANVPLPPGTADAGWLRAISGVVPVLVRSFAPEVLVTQCGCDGHWRDPLTDLRLTTDGFAVAYAMLHELAQEVCAGRWVVLGGGGYDIGWGVPCSWTRLLAEVGSQPLSPLALIPESWRVQSTCTTGDAAPRRIGELTEPLSWQPWDAGSGDVDSPLDRSVDATRRAVLPLHGLDPFYDR